MIHGSAVIRFSKSKNKDSRRTVQCPAVNTHYDPSAVETECLNGFLHFVFGMGSLNNLGIEADQL